MRKIYFQLLTALLLAACGEHAEHAGYSRQSTVTSSYLTPYADYASYDKNVNLDSLRYLENIVPDDTGKVWLLINTGIIYRDFRTPDDMETSKQYFARARELSEQLNYKRGIYRSMVNYSITLSHQDDDSELEYKQEILDMAIRENNESWTSMARHNIGIYYYYKRNYTRALEYILLSLPTVEKTGDSDNLVPAYTVIQMIYSSLGIPEKGVEYGEKALALLSDRPDDDLRRMVLVELAHNYSLLRPQNFEKVLETLNEALRIALLNNATLETTTIYLYFSTCYYDMGAFEIAKEYAFKALEIDRELETKKGMSADMLYIAQAEFALQNIRETKKWALEGYAIAKENGFLSTLEEVTKILSAVSLYNRDFDDYYLYLNENDSIKKNLDQDKQSMIVQDLETKYEMAKKELEIERQQQVIRRRDIQRGLLVAGVTVCAVLLVLLWFMLRLRSRRNAALNERNLALSERNAALSEMNATKDKFFSIISHDLRNPVVAQRDALKMLVQNSSVWDADMLSGYYRELLNSADGQVELVYNLLSWAQLQTGRITYNPSTFNLAHRLRSDINLIRNMAEKKGVAFAASIPEDADITGDAAMLSIVVRNLLTNAVKFTEASPDPSRRGEEGTVTLSATPVYGGGDATDTVTGYVIAVSDTGVGMSEEQVDSLFRLDSARSQPGTAGEQGTGLGLIVCRDLLERHGCELRVESKKGVGSTFSFELQIKN